MRQPQTARIPLRCLRRESRRRRRPREHRVQPRRDRRRPRRNPETPDTAGAGRGRRRRRGLAPRAGSARPSGIPRTRASRFRGRAGTWVPLSLAPPALASSPRLVEHSTRRFPGGAIMAPRTQPVSFPGASGAMLSARLDAPDGPPLAYALFAHCFTCAKDTKAAAYISAALAERGIAVLRFDFTGLGGSEGDFANTNFSSNIGDLVAAADFLRKDYRAPAILIGHSLGGAAVLCAAPDIPECTAVATIGSPFDPKHVLGLIANSTRAIEREGEAQVEIAGRAFRIKKQFLDDIRGHRLGEIA